MTAGKPARVISFSREQGFGRVAVEGEGELNFDGDASACSPEELVADAEVRVLTGPARVAGKIKVTRLWAAEAAPPEPARAGESAPERFETMGPYRFLLPPFWPDEPVRARDPLWTSAANIDEVKCMFLVYVGGANDTKARADLIDARARGARRSRCDVELLGVSFEGHRFEKPDEVEVLHLVDAHGDLLTTGCAFAPSNRAAEWLWLMLQTMVSAAVIRRGPVLPAKPKEPGFWQRLFGRA